MRSQTMLVAAPESGQGHGAALGLEKQEVVDPAAELRLTSAPLDAGGRSTTERLGSTREVPLAHGKQREIDSASLRGGANRTQPRNTSGSHQNVLRAR